MKDMFGRELNKWDIVAISNKYQIRLALVIGNESVKTDYFTVREIDLKTLNLKNNLDVCPDEVCSLSVPERIKVHFDTIKFYGDDIEEI